MNLSAKKIDRRGKRKNKHSSLDFIDEQNYMEFEQQHQKRKSKTHQQLPGILKTIDMFNSSEANQAKKQCEFDLTNNRSLKWDSNTELVQLENVTKTVNLVTNCWQLFCCDPKYFLRLYYINKFFLYNLQREKFK